MVLAKGPGAIIDRSAWTIMRSCWAGSLCSRVLVATVSFPVRTLPSQLAAKPFTDNPIASASSATLPIREWAEEFTSGKLDPTSSINDLVGFCASCSANSFEPDAPNMASQALAKICQRFFGSELIQLSARSVG